MLNLYLSGGGNSEDSRLLDKKFIDSLPNKKFVYIPIALKGDKKHPYNKCLEWINNTFSRLTNEKFEISLLTDLSGIDIDDLKTFDGIYIGGGNTWSLMQEIKNSGFYETLIRYIKSGGQVYGGSAGAIIFGKRIDTHDDENEIEFKDISGFNLLHGYSVACHFKDVQSNRFKMWAINNNLPIICLPEETGLIIKNSTALCTGTKLCVIYYASGTKRNIHPEELFKL